MAVYKCAGRRRGVCEYEAAAGWKGPCPGCGRFYSCDKLGLDNADQKARSTFAAAAEVKKVYVPTGVEGFDKVVGGGLVAGCVILFGGFRGAGKSSLLTQLCDGVAKNKGRAIYASSEENVEGVISIAHRQQLLNDAVEVLGNQGAIEETLERVKEVNPFLTVYDSLQKYRSQYCAGVPGSPAQGAAVASAIQKHHRDTKTCAIIVNHMARSGELKGGTDVEHDVDTLAVLAYPKEDDEDAPGAEGDGYRMLIVDKNRNGPENLKSYWRMTEDGQFVYVPPKSRIVDLNSRRGKYRRD